MTEKSNLIASDLIRHQVRVIRNLTRVVNIVQAQVLGQLEATIVGTLIAAAPDEPTRRGDQLNRADAATAEVATHARAAMRRADGIVIREGAEIVRADQLATARIYARRDIAVRPAPDGVIRRIVNATILQGAETGEWWARQAESVRRSFSDELKAGLREGEALADLVKRIKGTPRAGGVINQGRKRDAETLVRTSVQSQLSGVRDEMFRRNKDVIDAQQFMTAFDSRVCPQCAAFSGAIYTLDGEPTADSPVKIRLPFGGTPIHPNCLPGDAKVTPGGRITGESRRHYEGDLVVIRTARGFQLAVTPNHPILTSAGWVPAREVHEVGDVISSGVGYGVSDFRARPDDQQMPAPIEQVASARLDALGVPSVEVPASAPDFHGDGIDGAVNIIRAERFLEIGAQASIPEHVGEGQLIGRLSTRSRLRHFFKRFGQDRSSAHCGMCGSDLLAAIVGRLLRPLEQFSFGPAAHRNAGLAQSVDYRGAADTELARQLQNGLAGPVSRDKIVNVDRQWFRGLVHNLETSTSAYMAEGIMVHNCRCIMIAVLDDEGPAEDIGFEDWLRAQPASVQVEVLGRKRRDLWAEGKLKLSQLVDQRGRPMGVKELLEAA